MLKAVPTLLTAGPLLLLGVRVGMGSGSSPHTLPMARVPVL